MKIVEIFAVNKQVEHVVALPAHLQSRLNPVECGRLEELGRLERSEQISAIRQDDSRTQQQQPTVVSAVWAADV